MLVSLGLDFRQARLEVRERFHLEDEGVHRAFEALARHGASEAVMNRTCNRSELYCWWPEAAAESGRLDPGRKMARAWVGGDAAEVDVLLASARVRVRRDAARHLFRVAAGLESQILGDIHILGQVRRAFRDAREVRSVGPHLHRLFETALRVGNQVKRETRLMTTRPSVGSEAARRATERCGGAKGRSFVVLGCGKSGTHAARMLSQLGATDLTVVNRTFERAEKLARELGTARAASLEGLAQRLARADVVIVATGAQEPVVCADALQEARARGTMDRPLLVIDVSVPRNVESEVGSLPHVELVDLDGLHPAAAHVEHSRAEAVPQVEAVVDEAVAEFGRWLELRMARRALGPLHEAISEICRRELSHLAGASPEAERTAERIVASIMAHPMTVLRAASERGEPLDEAADALALFFADRRRWAPRSGPRRRGAAPIRNAPSKAANILERGFSPTWRDSSSP